MKTLLLLLMLLGNSNPYLRVYSTPRIPLSTPGEGAVVTIHARIEGIIDEKWYCPTVTFYLSDGTKAVRESDCDPFEEVEQKEMEKHWEITRRFSEGTGTITVELSKSGKIFAREVLELTIH